MKLSPLLLLLGTITTALALDPQQQQQPLTNHHRAAMTSLSETKPSGTPLLGDIIPLDRQISIFSGFTRSIESISTLLSNRAENTTVLAPSNIAVSRLPRKPWEDPNDEQVAASVGGIVADLYRGILGEDRASRNLRRFVEAHLVGISPWEEGSKVKTVEGVEVWWERRDGAMWVMPGDVKVLQVKTEVANGQLWIIDGVVNYDR